MLMLPRPQLRHRLGLISVGVGHVYFLGAIANTLSDPDMEGPHLCNNRTRYGKDPMRLLASRYVSNLIQKKPDTRLTDKSQKAA